MQTCQHHDVACRGTAAALSDSAQSCSPPGHHHNDRDATWAATSTGLAYAGEHGILTSTSWCWRFMRIQMETSRGGELAVLMSSLLPASASYQVSQISSITGPRRIDIACSNCRRLSRFSSNGMSVPRHPPPRADRFFLGHVRPWHGRQDRVIVYSFAVRYGRTKCEFIVQETLHEARVCRV